MALILSVLPIVLLIYLMVKRNALPSYIALPLIAALVYAIQYFYFNGDLLTLNANVVSALISVMTPITVIFGAVLFNRMMEISGAMDVMRRWLGNISPNPVAQLMIIGWAFAFMIEGASGFGTPAAIAAPLLVGLGFRPLQVAILALIMNSVPVSFGAVGTPTWFGFGTLINKGDINDAQLSEIGQITAVIHFIAAFVVPILALKVIVSWKQIRQNLLFIILSILSCTVPYVVIAWFNYEFPSLVGGAIGLFISVGLASAGIGLSKNTETHEGSMHHEKVSTPLLLKALFPTASLILMLAITRIKQLPFKAMLNDSSELFSLNLGGLGNFHLSKGLIFSLSDIFTTSESASYKLLYVPALIPFVITVLIAIPVFSLSFKQSSSLFSATFKQVQKPFLALVGALIMVNVMLIGGENSMVQIIGHGLANATGEYWTVFASYLGAIGAFFSGSNTVSNLTFGGVQYSVAMASGLSVPLILALQSVGGAMGNMVCINNIIAVCSVLGIDKAEGKIIKTTAVPMFVYGIIAAIVALFVIPLFF